MASKTNEVAVTKKGKTKTAFPVSVIKHAQQKLKESHHPATTVVPADQQAYQSPTNVFKMMVIKAMARKFINQK